MFLFLFLLKGGQKKVERQEWKILSLLGVVITLCFPLSDVIHSYHANHIVPVTILNWCLYFYLNRMDMISMCHNLFIMPCPNCIHTNLNDFAYSTSKMFCVSLHYFVDDRV